MAEQEQRRPTFQNIAWFWDLYRRELLDLNPPYQRRSVWNPQFQKYFIETVLLEYPAPSIFLHEDMATDGTAKYSVVDGKQRLTTVFDYAQDLFTLDQASVVERATEKYFTSLDEALQLRFWRYQFSVEFVPSTDEAVLTDVFGRINKNTAKLTRQELRHAKFGGIFATAVEDAVELMDTFLPVGFPRIAESSRRQMKDLELGAQLLLLVENGPETFSQDDLDDAYSDRDEVWDERAEVDYTFGRVVNYLAELGKRAEARRLRNQADFYSLFGAIVELLGGDEPLPEPGGAATRLEQFMAVVEDDAGRLANDEAKRYYDAARSASNDLVRRRTRIEIVRNLLTQA